MPLVCFSDEDSTPTTPVGPKKEVTFDKSHITGTTSATLPVPGTVSAPPMTRDTTKMTEEDIMKVPGEIPIIEKRQRPASAEAERMPPPKSVSAKKDASLVLSYLKKNMYDDTRKFQSYLSYVQTKYIQ